MPSPQPSSALQLRSGAAVTLAERIGGGGEGTVYGLRGQSSAVAKVYHSGLTGERLKKLEAMIDAGTASLSKITAWPNALLYSGAKPVGFIMPRAEKAEEAHVLYGLKSRKQRFPNAGFRFLVHVAMNVARAFATVHKCGFVIGDVNERVAMIGHDGQVRLIDCDSFQIKFASQIFLCEVGVPTFTPPELQQVPSFRGIERTEQHDAFGLAVLLFHLLFLGRHPFAGRYRKPTDMPIETAIQQHRFAYSADHNRTMMEPPPNTPGLTYSGPGLAALFEQAFSPAAAAGHQRRPTAAQWADALEAFLSSLVPCKENAAHAYVPANGPCPWCAIELNSRIDLFHYVEPTGTTTSTIDYEAIWRAIDGLPQFQLASAPSPSQLKQGLTLSPEAELIRKSRAEKQAIAAARKTLAEASRVAEEQERQLKDFEHEAVKAHAHVAAFDTDGARLLEVQQQYAASTSALDRYTLYQRITMWGAAPAALGCFAALQNINIAIAPVLLAVFAGATFVHRRTETELRIRVLTKELHSLRTSIDLGVGHRKKLALEADQLVAKVRSIVASLQSHRDGAALAERSACDGATVSEAAAANAKVIILSRHDAAKKSIEQLSSNSHPLRIEFANGWQDVVHRKLAAQTIYKAIQAIEFRRAAARQKAHDDAHDAQLNDFLDRFFIAKENWPRIPKSTLSALSSYGIETAADINRTDVLKVPGFGEVRTRLLLDWRATKARGFRFDPTKGDHSSRLQLEERRLIGERRQQERALARIKAQFDAVVGPLESRKRQYEREIIRRRSAAGTGRCRWRNIAIALVASRDRQSKDTEDIHVTPLD